MNRTLFAFCTLLVSIGVNAQTFEWAKSFGSSLADYGLSIALDASGNVYTTGYFQGTADFDPGAGTANRTSSGGRDIWVQKLDASGNFIWARSFGGSLDDIGRSITVDAHRGMYILQDTFKEQQISIREQEQLTLLQPGMKIFLFRNWMLPVIFYGRNHSGVA